MVNVEIQAHLDNLPGRVRTFGAAQTWLNFIEEAHLDGWQLSPHYAPPRHMHRLDVLTHAVTSLYRPWTYRVGLQERMYPLVPGTEAPAGGIAGMQARLLQNGASERVPTVIQTNYQHIGNRSVWRTDYRELCQDGAVGPMLCQLGARTLRAWGITTRMKPADAIEVVLDAQKVRGFDGVALDLRALDAGGQFPEDWVEGLVSRLALRGGLSGPKDYGYSEVVVTLPSSADGQRDVRKIVAGELDKTRIGHLLKVIRSNVMHDYVRVTIHAPPATFRRLGRYRAGNKAVSVAIRRLFMPQRMDRLRS